jgi:hypothetical protein
MQPRPPRSPCQADLGVAAVGRRIREWVALPMQAGEPVGCHGSQPAPVSGVLVALFPEDVPCASV